MVNVWLFDWLKWGSIIPILFALFVFAVYFYDAKTLVENWQRRPERESSVVEETEVNNQYSAAEIPDPEVEVPKEPAKEPEYVSVRE